MFSCLNCLVCIKKHWIRWYNLIKDFSSQILAINALFKPQFSLQGCTRLPLCWSVWLENHITFLCELLWRFQVTNNRDFNPLFFQTICKSEPSKHMCRERVWPVVWRTLWFTASLKYFELRFLRFYFKTSLVFSPACFSKEWSSKNRYTD